MKKDSLSFYVGVLAVVCILLGAFWLNEYGKKQGMLKFGDWATLNLRPSVDGFLSNDISRLNIKCDDLCFPFPRYMDDVIEHCEDHKSDTNCIALSVDNKIISHPILNKKLHNYLGDICEGRSSENDLCTLSGEVYVYLRIIENKKLIKTEELKIR